jgi:hypothetical protein
VNKFTEERECMPQITQNCAENVNKNNHSIETKLAEMEDSLIRFKHRPTFVIFTLTHLKHDLQFDYELGTNLIKLMLVLIRKNSNVKDVQQLAIECLILMLKNSCFENFAHGKHVKSIISDMESHPNNESLQQILLSMILKDLMPGVDGSPIYRYECLNLMLNSLVNFKKFETNSIAIEICTNICDHLSINEKPNVGLNAIYLQSLIELVKIAFTQLQIIICLN